MKHGLYTSIMSADEIVNLETVKSKSLVHELVLTRIMLQRLSRCLENEDLPAADVRAVAPLMFAGARTVIQLLNHIDEDEIDWDKVLDNLGNELGIEL